MGGGWLSVAYWKGGIRIKIKGEEGRGVEVCVAVVGGGEAGVLEELVAGEAGGGGVFGVGEGAEALDAQGEVGLCEEAGLLSEELGAELAVGLVLFGELELLEFIFGEGRVRAGGCRVFGSEITGANATGSDGCCTGGAGVRGVRGFLGFEQAGHDFPSFIPWRMRGAFVPSGVHIR